MKGRRETDQREIERELVLVAIKKRPYVTAARIAEVTGIPLRAVVTYVTHMAAGDVIHSVPLDRKPGATRSPGLGYRFGIHPDIKAAREAGKRIPKQWDVLAMFFGRMPEIETA